MKYLLPLIMLLSGCYHAQYVKDTYENGERKTHEIISSTQVLYFSNKKNITVKYNDLDMTVGESELKIPSEILQLIDLWMAGNE